MSVQLNEKRVYNKYLKIIDDFLSSLNPHLSTEDIAGYFGKSDKEFRSANNNFPKGRRGQKSSQEPFKITFIRQMVLALNNFPYERFILDSEDESAFIKRMNEKAEKRKGKRGNSFNQKDYFLATNGDLDTQVYTPWSPQDSIIELENLRDLRGNHFKEKYLKAVSRFVENTKYKLWVHEIIGKDSMDIPKLASAGYASAHEDIFSIIEQKIEEAREKNIQFDYRRVLVLPLTDNLDILEYEEGIVHAIKDCSLPTFIHVFKCLNNIKYENFVKIYVAPLSRPYHYGIIDDRFVVSEYYRYEEENMRRVSRPNLLFVEKIPKSGKSKILVDEYIQEIEKSTIGRGWRLTLDKFKLFINRLELKFENDLMMIERKINRAKESSEFESEQERLNFLDDLQRKKVNTLNTLENNIKIKKDIVLLSEA